MNFNLFKTNDADELIARGSYKPLRFYAILLTGFFLGGLIDLYINPKTFHSTDFAISIFISAVFLSTAIFFWYKVYDRKIKMIINKNGIISHKTGIIRWEEIRYFYIQETFFKGRDYHFLILKSTTEKEYKIELSYFDKTFEQVRKAIIINSNNNVIIDLGFETNK